MAVGSKIAILLNGPPRAGKDTAVAVLEDAFGAESETFKFTQPVKDRTHARFGLDCAHDAYEALKDTPLPEFGGMTPREAYIDTSRRLKEEQGEDAVRKLFVAEILASNAQIILNPDAGDDLEAESVADAFGAENVLVIRISRDGHDFSKDCRTWVTSRSLRIVDVTNEEGRRREYESQVVALARSFVDTVRGRTPEAAVPTLAAE